MICSLMLCNLEMCLSCVELAILVFVATVTNIDHALFVGDIYEPYDRVTNTSKHKIIIFMEATLKFQL